MLSCPSWTESNAQVWLDFLHGAPKDELICSFKYPSKLTYLSNEAAMAVAYVTALRGIGSVSPNPLVGCVAISRDNLFLSHGAHLKNGESHAEVNCLTALENQEIQNAKVFVTLEPCAHHGRTPPCAEFLSKLPFEELHYLQRDPDSRVDGRGIELIKDAGKKVFLLDAMSELGAELAEIFLWNKREDSPFIGAKIAMTEAGAYAFAKSSRTWITGQRAREHGRFLRLYYDAILVGSSTAVLDDPMLDVRSSFVNGRIPWRIVLDPENVVPLTANIFKVSPERVIHFVTAKSSSPGPRVVTQDVRNEVQEDAHGDDGRSSHIIHLNMNSQGQFEWQDVIRAVKSFSIYSILLEGGNGVWSSAWQAGVINKLHLYVGQSRLVQDKLALLTDVPQKAKWNPEDKERHRFGIDRYFEIVNSAV
ncbi:MAG: bifunctional diaminohydroxyphosphoribosylaminopyrimidine deaminase/5-amino-6-(5-phosphoribosylamino)uracil reductase RibD [Proteobacteria bacterium]|nr:bifunctional diaminohydroxyphosphoribosylaminopyrimidine deaminase/5-amino-6-(5-phosphoribosylamino)uracil reductase RibD [Pseudomonadota bacterium]